MKKISGLVAQMKEPLFLALLFPALAFGQQQVTGTWKYKLFTGTWRFNLKSCQASSAEEARLAGAQGSTIPLLDVRTQT